MCRTKHTKRDWSICVIPFVGILFIDENSAHTKAYVFVYVDVYLTASPGCPWQCDHYRRGIISGSSCKALCDQRTLRLQHCMSTSSTHQAKHCSPSHFGCLSVGVGLALKALCCPVTAGVQWGVEGEACRDQVWC